MNNLEVLSAQYYANFSSNYLLAEISKEIDPGILLLKKEYQVIFFKMIKKDPFAYWDKAVFVQTIDILERTFQSMHSPVLLTDMAIENFLMGYDSYFQLTETILDLENFNLSVEIKTRLYRIPTYTALVESCMANFLRSIAALLGRATGKDYSRQQKLGPLLDVMRSNGLTEVAEKIDVNIRNAINHGKFSFQRTPQDEIKFFYTKNGEVQATSVAVYEFDNLINSTYDAVSAVLLALVVFMNRHIQIGAEVYASRNITSFSLLSMRLSLPDVVCQSISDIPNRKQINIEVSVKNTDQNFLAMLSIELGVMIYEVYRDYEKYMISFQNPRLGMCWARYSKEDLLSVLDDLQNMSVIYAKAIQNSEFIYYKPNNENVDLNEEKYFCFPNYESDTIKINHVADASLQDRKRLKANVFIGEISDKNQIMAAIDEAVNWLKYVKNPPCAKIPRKNGVMEADALYINVYRKDTRKDKALLPNNHNFVCFLDYNLNGTTTLLNGGLPAAVWKQLYHEKNGKYDIAWREAKYITRTIIKVGANDPCPCGSGKKFKKCCRGKGIYD